MAAELVLCGSPEELESSSALQILCSAFAAGVSLSQSTTSVTTIPAGGPVLVYGGIQIATTNAALRLVAKLSPAATLLGDTEIQQAQVDAWLNVLWSSVDVPLQALREGVAKEEELQAMLQHIEQHLGTSQFLAGDSLTVADIKCACLLKEHALTDYVNLQRLVDFCLGQAWYAEATGGKTPVTTVAAPTAAGVQRNGPAPAVEHVMYRRHRIRIKELVKNDGADYLNQTVTVAGWARTLRKQGARLLFIELSDGSTSQSIQCVLADCEGFDDCVSGSSGGTGASFQLDGQLVASKGEGQAVELSVSKATLLGAVYAGNPEGTTIGGAFYPVPKKESTLEHFRDVAHLRARTQTHAAAMRIRHAMAYATHNFFHNHGFVYIHTPILTGADCEGAGEQFGVSTLLGNDHLATDVELPKVPHPDPDKKLSKSEMKRLAKKKGKVDPNKPVEEVVPGAVDYSTDFFGQRVNLTVSGQLNVETHACAMSDVYTFGPTFRAEESYTSRHLSEFWMIEPEIAFARLEDDINLAEDYLKYCVKFALENCSEDLEFFENSPHGEKGLRDRLRNVLENPFKRITYTEAIEILQKAVTDGHKFEETPEWGMDLPSEHERYICEQVFKQPVVLMDYPKDIKAFYMKLNDDGKTVAAADVLVPKIGEIIGGSEREYRMDVLKRRCEESGLDPRNVWWYLDLRRYGSVPHAGFGLGFERLILFVTGLSNIRDVIPFPRWAGNAKF